MGGDRSGELSAPASSHLKPEKDDRPEVSAAADRVDLDDLHRAGFTADERDDADGAVDRMARLLRDQAMVEDLRGAGFEGTRYEVFKAVLAQYGFPVMRALIRRRQIFQLTAARGRPVVCPDEVRDHLAQPRGADDRQELAMDVVATALGFFREHVLVPGVWSPQGGASLTTFFTGACISVFPNVFRTWLKEYLLDRKVVSYELHPDADLPSRRLLDAQPDVDPVEAAYAAELLREALNAAPNDRLRRVIATVVLTDAEYAEIAEREGTSADAIKQALYRFRKNVGGVEGRMS